MGWNGVRYPLSHTSHSLKVNGILEKKNRVVNKRFIHDAILPVSYPATAAWLHAGHCSCRPVSGAARRFRRHSRSSCRSSRSMPASSSFRSKPRIRAGCARLFISIGFHRGGASLRGEMAHSIHFVFERSLLTASVNSRGVNGFLMNAVVSPITDLSIGISLV